MKIEKNFKSFYLGFLASIGLGFGSLMIITFLRGMIEFYLKIDLLVYSRIAFSVFYLFFLYYTYLFLEMNKDNNQTLRKGFILFTILFIIGQIIIWIP